jgi:hypothetical protein
MEAIMRAKRGRVRVSAILLAFLLLAGCGAQQTFTPSQLRPTLPFALQPDAVRIHRTSTTFDNATASTYVLNVTRTDSIRVTRFFANIRSSPTYIIPPVFDCPEARFRSCTLISFLDGANVLMQVTTETFGCTLISIVGYPRDVGIFVDASFVYDLNDLIANPS